MILEWVISDHMLMLIFSGMPRNDVQLLEFLLSFKSCELSGPELGLGQDDRGGAAVI